VLRVCFSSAPFHNGRVVCGVEREVGRTAAATYALLLYCTINTRTAHAPANDFFGECLPASFHRAKCVWMFRVGCCLICRGCTLFVDEVWQSKLDTSRDGAAGGGEVRLAHSCVRTVHALLIALEKWKRKRIK